MQVTFPQADNFQINRGLFIAAWKVWFKRFDVHEQWKEGRMPVRAIDKTLCQLLGVGHRFSGEVLCRLLVPWHARNYIQCTEEFVKLNPAIIRSVDFTGDDGIEPGLRLTDQALDHWERLPYVMQDYYLAMAEARVQADIETRSNEPVVVDDAGIEVIGEDIYPLTIPAKADGEDKYVKALVEWIENDPYHPMYKRQPVGEAISGWDNRVRHLFWPKPRVGFFEMSQMNGPSLYRATTLAQQVDAGEAWTIEEQSRAVKLAHTIFDFFGVPQRDITWQNVRGVMEAALKADAQATAKMNSGWTHLAAYSTAWLEGKADRLPLAGWNSRVASALTTRLDFLLVEAGHQALGDFFPGIGTVPGWGGTRPRELSLTWPDAYRSWASQISVSKLLAAMRDELNQATNKDGKRKYPLMPLPKGGTGKWTVLGVQWVLFADGY